MLTTDGGVGLYVNLNKYALKAEAFGVTFSSDEADASTNAVQMQKALDWLYAEGSGGRIELASEGHLVTDMQLGPA